MVSDVSSTSSPSVTSSTALSFASSASSFSSFTSSTFFSSLISACFTAASTACSMILISSRPFFIAMSVALRTSSLVIEEGPLFWIPAILPSSDIANIILVSSTLSSSRSGSTMSAFPSFPTVTVTTFFSNGSCATCVVLSTTICSSSSLITALGIFAVSRAASVAIDDASTRFPSWSRT